MSDPFGCIAWHGRKTSTGYGRDGLRGAHVKAWTDANGSVPDGFVVDHLCQNRACYALHHLEAVTQSENLLRRSWAYRARRKLCPKGHDMQTNAVVTGHRGIVCRSCNREAMR